MELTILGHFKVSTSSSFKDDKSKWSEIELSLSTPTSASTIYVVQNVFSHNSMSYSSYSIDADVKADIL